MGITTDRIISWSTAPYQVALFAGVAFVLAWGARSSDPAGALLLGAAAALFASAALRDGLLRPTLAVDSRGLLLRPWLRAYRVPWEQIGAIRATSSSRRLLVLRSLEIEVADRLVVLESRRLGGDPVDAAAQLEELRPGV